MYKAFLDPDAMVTWLPPHGFTGKVHSMDARAGGGYKMSFTNFGTGTSHSFGGTYVELTPPTSPNGEARIRYTDKFDDPGMPGVMQVTITFRKMMCGTELTIVQEGIPAMIPVEFCYAGWQESLSLLAHLAEPEIPDGPRCFRRRYTPPMDPLKIYDYLVRARKHVLDAVRPLTPQQYSQPFPFGLKTIGSTITHIMTAEWYYIERLEGRAVPPYAQWPIHYEPPETPAFDVIDRTWSEQAKRVRASIAAQSARAGGWSRTITWLSFPDDTRGNKRFHITCTAGDLFTQLALHEVHHRAQVMAMLRGLGRPVEDLDYNDMMYERKEANPGA